MFFNKKSKKQERCENCNSKISSKFSYCPFCGMPLFDEEQYAKDYGLLGNNEYSPMLKEEGFSFGITDKLINSLMNNVIKSFDNQLQFKINISPPRAKSSPPKKAAFQKNISEKQLQKISSLPRETAEAKVKRLNDKIIYELNAPGIESPEDVFISKLESGYEIKAIGDKKVYVNSLPVNLPLRKVSLNENKIFVEFSTYE